MALSFEESKKQLEATVRAQSRIASLAADDIAPMAVADIANDDMTTWQKPRNASFYTYYNDEYTDSKLSTVDENKNITLADNQINLTQEKNSQYIPFEIPRFYDGFDLATTELSIYWVNEAGAGSSAIPVDVYHSADKIRFAWLVDDDVTARAGKIKFEIQASGKNSKGFNYLWKTKCNDGINIIQALKIQKFIEPDETWQENFIQNLSVQATKAETARVKAEAAADRAQKTANEMRDDLRKTATEVIGEDYYNKAEVDEKVANVTVDLTGYATENYVKEQIDAIPDPDLSAYARMEDVPKKTSDLINDSGFLTHHQSLDGYALKSDVYTKQEIDDAGYLTEHQSLESYATKDYVQEKVDAVDVSEQLKDYATKVFVQEKIDAVDVSDQLKDYAKADAVYTKEETDAKDSTLSSSIATNASNLSSLSTTVASIQSTVNSIDKSPRKTYNVAYNDTEDPDVGENVFVLYEIENEGLSSESKTKKTQFVITGGSGGGTSSVLKIEYVTVSPIVATTNDTVIIKYRFSGTDSSGDAVPSGTATWKVNGTVVATNTALNGENSFDVTEYLTIGTQKVQLSITDDAGSLVTKTWNVQKIDVRIDSTFNDKLTYPIGEVAFDYTPYGAIQKTVHFVLDGQEVGTVNTSVSGIPMAYSLPKQEHGAHLLEVYMTAELNSSTIESNHIYKDIIWYNEESNVPVIGCATTKFTAMQYDSTNIVYTVYSPATESPVVTLAVDGEVVSTITMTSNTQTWQFKSSDIGEHVLTITCGETVKTINATIEKIDIDVTPITAGLVFDFNPSGKSNNDADRLWSSGDIAMSVSENFDWVNGGYQLDENGDQYFCVKAGTTATINYNLFADDARRNGKEFKLIFKTTNVAKSDATFLTCQSSGIGLQMNVHEAYIRANAKSLYVPYSEEDIIEWEFNIAKDTDIPIVMSYEDGTPCRPMSYTSDYSFTQENPVPITIGSTDCDVLVYRIKAYNTSLSSSAILSNFIADARTATEMVARYKRNQIYDENNSLTPESVAEACPNMRIIKIEAPYFTNDKKNYVKNTSMECIYKNGDPILDNWKFTNLYHAGQGTTSNEYGAAGRNIDVICCADGVHQINSKIPLDPDYKAKLVLGDGTEFADGTGKISLTRDSVPNNWFNFKVNIASSEMENNALLQKRFNTYLPYSTPATRRDSKIKNDMEFVNCVIFIKESDPDITQHREFQDCEYHYYALANMGDSKKTDHSRAYDPDDMNEFCIEISDNTLPNSTFQTGVTNPDGSMKYPISKDEWKAGNTAYDNLYNNWDGSFEFRYDCCGDTKDGSSISTDEEKEKIRVNNKQIWRDFYEFVITSSDEEFVSNLKNWFIVDSALYLYLFTTRYTMIDNRSKNLFPHWAKHYISEADVETLGDKAAYYTVDDAAASINHGYRFDFWNYDND